MPSKKKKYNARFPAGRIKKIMQSDEEIGKVAQAVPVIILELFVESLLTKTLKITNSRNAKTLSTSHMKQCIIQEQRFDFLRELVKNIPDINVAEEEAANYNETDEANGGQSSPDSQEQEQYPDSDTPYDLSMPSTSSTMHRRRADQNGSNSHAMHLRGAPPAAPAEFSIDVVVDLTDDVTRRVNLKRSASAANANASSSSSSSVIMHTKAIAAGNGGERGGGDCLPQPKLARSESTPAAAHQSSCRPRLKPQYSQLNNQSKNNHKKLLPKPTTQQNQEQVSLQPPQTAAAISPAQPIFSYDFCNKPLVKLDYSNLPISAGVVGASAAIVAPLSAPVQTSCGSAAAFTFNVAAPVINIDLSNIAVSPQAPPIAASVYRPAVAANTTRRAVGPSSEVSSNLLDPKATSFSVSSTMSPQHKPSNNNNLGSCASTHSNFCELDEDYDNI